MGELDATLRVPTQVTGSPLDTLNTMQYVECQPDKWLIVIASSLKAFRLLKNYKIY